ncbi:hypothetical protein [Wolbachia endosymbiont of Ctenocephalides felis wCfeJ]|uniref:hypothetical protein n=1 Tax=Wolbachia endosymbiont of Ctenocephalides felis wCfeJ TaxID=2732594 RepID=UPI001447A5FD|nr:hypothetical protein [Wolbachia endosymbiont of Ctenocephalides felis wCfeJ]
MKKRMDPSIKYWDDKKRSYLNDIIRLLGCIVEATGMTSTALSFQRVTLESRFFWTGSYGQAIG